MARITVDEALTRIIESTSRGKTERVALTHAGGRVLAEDVVARLTQPPFHASAMDGYAVRAQDVTYDGIKLAIIGEAAAGCLYDGMVERGEAVRIFTGAPIPRGADTVVIQEETVLLEANFVKINKSLGINKNIRPLGGDFLAGETLLKAGHLMTPAALALCAAAGHGTVDVIAKPRIGLISTGDELVAAGNLPKEGQIIASNSYALAEIIRLNGGHAIDLGIIPDDRMALQKAIDEARAQQIDILVTSGGASVGSYDLVQEVLCAAGMRLDFWKIAMRPGKPLIFGRLPTDKQDILVLGLPGNPVSSLVTAHLFLVPMLEKMSGKNPDLTLYEAILTTSLGKNGPRRHYIRARMMKAEDGTLMVTPDPSFDSSLLSVLARANCLIVVPENNPEQASGKRCQIFIPKGGL